MSCLQSRNEWLYSFLSGIWVTLPFHCHAYRMAGRRGSVSLSCLPDDRKTLLLLCFIHFYREFWLHPSSRYRMAGRRGSAVSLSCPPDGSKAWLCSSSMTACLCQGETEVSFRYCKGQAALGGTLPEKQECPSFSSTHGRARTRRILRSSKPACA